MCVCVCVLVRGYSDQNKKRGFCTDPLPGRVAIFESLEVLVCVSCGGYLFLHCNFLISTAVFITISCTFRFIVLVWL